MNARPHRPSWRCLMIVVPLAASITLLWAAGVAARPGGRLATVPASASWTTGGPYGGGVLQLAVNPVTPTTAYALLASAGLYVTDDGGASWRPSMIDSMPQSIALDAGDPSLVFFAGRHHLYRSSDGGATWDVMIGAPTPGDSFCLLAHPITSGVLYLGVGVSVGREPEAGETGGVFRWDDGAGEWSTVTANLTDTQVTTLSFRPDDAQTMVAGTRDGHVFVSTDAGKAWQWRARVDDYVYRLVYNSLVPGEVWALTRNPSAPSEPPCFYRSTDPSLANWEEIKVPCLDDPAWPLAVAFDELSDMAYLAVHAQPALVSTDGGASWQPMDGSPPYPTCFGMTPAGLGYIGTYQRGTYVSGDGVTWERAVQGLAGVLPDGMAAIPGQPEVTYAYARTLGMLATADGGQSWDEIDAVRRDGFPWRANVLAAEGGAEPRLYLGSQCSGTPCLKVGDIASHDWTTHTLPMPELSGEGWTADVFATYADPCRPGRVLAGVTFYPPDFDYTVPSRPLGAIYRSDDRGNAWTVAHGVDATAVISGVVEFAASPAAPEVIYAATDGTGLLRSTDGGASWEPVAGWTGPAAARSVALDRADPHTIYVTAYDGQSPSGVFVSRDDGSSWELMPGTGGSAWVLHMAATEPPMLYLGTDGAGVLRLERDDTWSQVVGVPEHSVVMAITSARDAERAIVYVGLTGDGGDALAAGTETGAVLAAVEARSGGIYQLVVPHTRRLHLPLAAGRHGG